jgi:hypothetical protein
MFVLLYTLAAAFVVAMIWLVFKIVPDQGALTISSEKKERKHWAKLQEDLEAVKRQVDRLVQQEIKTEKVD